MSSLKASTQKVLSRTVLFSVQILATAIVAVAILGLVQSSRTTALNAGPTACDSDVQLFSADANDDGVLDISDPVWLLSYLFESGPAPLCLAQTPSPLDPLFVNEGQLDSITSDMVVDGTVQEADLAFDPIVEGQGDSVTSGMIVDGTVQLADLAFDPLVPAGTISAFAGATPPSGWLLCDGSSVLVGDFADLHAAIGDAHGGDGGTNFNLPDLRGMFLRGVDQATGNDPDAGSRTAAATGGNTGDAVGSVQSDEIVSHSHDFGSVEEFIIETDDTAADPDRGSGTMSPVTHQTDATGGNETRPVNVAVNWIIKT